MLWVCLCLFRIDSAQALEATAAQRIPFCLTPVKKCAPLFFLRKGEPLSVLYRQNDIWMKVKHKASGRSGWVESSQLNLLLPRKLSRGKVQRSRELMGIVQGVHSGTFTSRAFESVSEKTAFSDGFFFLSQNQAQAAFLDKHILPVFYAIEAVEKRFVLEQIDPFVKPVSYRTLAHFDKKQDFYGVATHGGLTLIAGDAKGSWGKSALLALDESQWPVWIIRDLREMWAILPGVQQSQLRADDFELLRLSPEGDLLVSAYHQRFAQKVLLHWRYEGKWIFQNVLRWPTGLKAKEVSDWFLTAGTEALVLAVNTKEKSSLYVFPVGMSEPSLQRVFSSSFKSVLWVEDDIWVLDEESLTRWKPQYSPQKKP